MPPAPDPRPPRPGERPDDPAYDPIEVWGTRIGRSLSVVLAIALTWWLGHQLGWF